MHHFKHNQVLHEQIVLLNVAFQRVPEVASDDRVVVEDRGHGLYRVSVRYGFMEQPDVPQALRECHSKGLVVEPAQTSYYLGRENLLTTGSSTMRPWRKRLFAFMLRNAQPATQYFRLPPNRVLELGQQVAL